MPGTRLIELTNVILTGEQAHNLYPKCMCPRGYRIEMQLKEMVRFKGLCTFYLFFFHNINIYCFI